MPYIFTSGTSDRAEINPVNSFPAARCIFLIMGWWKHSSLSTNQRLWGVTTTFAVRIPTATTDYQLTVPRATTNYTRSWTATETNSWLHLSWLVGINNTTPVSVMWKGKTNTAPKQQTAASTANGSGTPSGGATTARLGNMDAGTTAFGGRMCDVTMCYSEKASPYYSDFFGATPADVGGQNYWDYAYNRFVLPHWRGEYDKFMGFGKERVAIDDGLIVHAPMNLGLRTVGYAGATFTQNPFLVQVGLDLATLDSDAPRPMQPFDRYPRTKRRR